MAEEKVVLDKETFKALSVDSRLTILKLLKLRNHTLTELAAELELSQSTVKEHLAKLEEAALIKQLDEGRKWKYYKLTQKGKNVVDPKEIKVLFMLIASSIAAVGLGARFLLRSLIKEAPMEAEVATFAARSMPPTYENTTALAQFPQQEVLLLVVLGVAVLLSITGAVYLYTTKHKLKKELEKKNE